MVMFDLFLINHAILEAQMLANMSEPERQAYCKARLENLERQRIEAETKRLEEESRAAYPHAWMLSDWVDGMLKMLDELESYEP